MRECATVALGGAGAWGMGRVAAMGCSVGDPLCGAYGRRTPSTLGTGASALPSMTPGSLRHLAEIGVECNRCFSSRMRKKRAERTP
jgi:hypothetical protein